MKKKVKLHIMKFKKNNISEEKFYYCVFMKYWLWKVNVILKMCDSLSTGVSEDGSTLLVE